MEAVILIGLLGLNIFQAIYWSRTTNQLIDKLMSRNYAEYAQIQSTRNHAQTDGIRLPDESETQEEEILNEINGLLPR